MKGTMIKNTADRPGLNHIRTPYQLLLIAAVLLIAYYPIAFGDFSLVDDGDIINDIRSTSSWSLHSLFMPRMQSGIYYRPILFLSFYFDKYVFNLDPGFMHLHNIILHVLNSLLVFCLARQVTEGREEGKSLLPFLSALFFGLHPIATESVCWIAGRTDLLACTFTLLSANCIVLFKKVHVYWYAVLAALFMVLGFLSKEVALAFLPGAFLLVYNWDYVPGEAISDKESTSLSRRNASQVRFFFLCALGAIISFFLLRHFAVATNDGRIGSTITSMQLNTIQVGFVLMQTISFYVKKMFFPFPLNFTIRDVDPLYELLGVPVMILCFLILSKRSRLSALFMTGIFLIAPSFPVALGQIAWTSFAERYIYLSTAFVMIAAVFFINNVLKKIPSFSDVAHRDSLYFVCCSGPDTETRPFKHDSRLCGNEAIEMRSKKSWTNYVIRKEVLVTLMLAVMAITTFHRSAIWKDNLAILKDSVVKNPQFYFVRGDYAYALALRGDFHNARIQYTIANEYNLARKRLKRTKAVVQLKYWEAPELGLADLLVRENKIAEAVKAYEKIIDESHGESTVAVNNVLFLYVSMLDSKHKSFSEAIKKKMASCSKRLYKEPGHADTYYWVAKQLLMKKEKQEALSYFRMAESKYSANNPYKFIAKKFINRLENQ